MNFGSNVKLLEALFDTLWDVVFCIKDRELRYVAVNQSLALRVQAANKLAMIGKQATDFFATELARAYDQQDQAVFETGQAVVDQLEQITNPDGTMGWYLTNKFPFLDERSAIQGVIGVSQDLHTPSDSELSIANLSLVVSTIKSNLSQTLRVEELAKLIDLSAEQLDRRMKKVFRLSTKKYIMKCRLERSAELLRSTPSSLAQIALDCGFSDQSALTRQFKETFLWTPAAYRQAQREPSPESSS
jgi:AraC-like DNA-binding protein